MTDVTDGSAYDLEQPALNTVVEFLEWRSHFLVLEELLVRKFATRLFELIPTDSKLLDRNNTDLGYSLLSLLRGRSGNLEFSVVLQNREQFLMELRRLREAVGSELIVIEAPLRSCSADCFSFIISLPY